MKRIAVLLACFNRREQTLRCLKRLFESNGDLAVYLVDDGSSDGTSDAVASDFPEVHLIRGDGSLFWNRGMHLAWSHAGPIDYEYYLWLNDDVVLSDHCISELLECSRLSRDQAIVSGIIDSHDHSAVIYGGTNRRKELLRPNGRMQPIVNMNGNVVLIPRAVFRALGNLDPVYHHDLGDVDYGLRALAKKVSVVTTRSIVGSCEKNEFCRVRLDQSNISVRLKRLYSPLGNDPHINFYFRKRHYGRFNAISYYIFLHLINILPDAIVHILFEEKYKTKNAL